MVLKRVHMYDINHHSNMPIMFMDLKKKTNLRHVFHELFCNGIKKNTLSDNLSLIIYFIIPTAFYLNKFKI